MNQTESPGIETVISAVSKQLSSGKSEQCSMAPLGTFFAMIKDVLEALLVIGNFTRDVEIEGT